MRRSRMLIAIPSAVVLLALFACGRAGGPEPADGPAMLSDGCAPLPGSPARPGTVVVALPERVDPAHAPRARNGSERLLFRHLYGTLIRVDCGGRLRPGLAESWSADGEGREWSFTLSPEASFWDGTLVTPMDVYRSWSEGASGVGGNPAAAASGRSGPPDRSDSRRPLLAGFTITGERSFRAVFSRPPPAGPRTFARPALAIGGGDTGAGWALGTGPYRIESGSDRRPGVWVARPAFAATDGGGAALEFRVAPREDPRDLLDGGVDLLITRDPEIPEYAESLGPFGSIPLPWDRTYVLAFGAGPVSPDGVGGEVPRRELARHAVQGEARPAEASSGREREDACAAPDSSTRPADEAGRAEEDAAPPSPPRGRRVVHPRGDPTARDLARRIVALASPGGDTSGRGGWLAPLAGAAGGVAGSLRAAGLRPGELAAAYREGTEAAYVFPVRRGIVGSCADAGGLLPLVDTRPRLVYRRGLAGMILDGDGTPLLSDAGWRSAAEGRVGERP